MKDKLTKTEFDEFLENIEIKSAPVGFTKEVMNKIEAETKIAPASFTKFKIIYGFAVSIILLMVFNSDKSKSLC